MSSASATGIESGVGAGVAPGVGAGAMAGVDAGVALSGGLSGALGVEGNAATCGAGTEDVKVASPLTGRRIERSPDRLRSGVVAEASGERCGREARPTATGAGAEVIDASSANAR